MYVEARRRVGSFSTTHIPHFHKSDQLPIHVGLVSALPTSHTFPHPQKSDHLPIHVGSISALPTFHTFPHPTMIGCVCEARAHAPAPHKRIQSFCWRSVIASPKNGKCAPHTKP